MKKLINVTVDVDDSYDSDTVGHIIATAIENCNTDRGFVNVVKVHLPLIPQETLATLMRNMRDAFESAGVDNAVFIPLHGSYLNDITIQEVRVSYELDKSTEEISD